MTAIIDMSQLPKPACVVPVDFQAELDYLLDEYTLGMREELEDDTFPRPLVSDPAYQILSTVAKRAGLKRQQQNDACHATMLAYAVDSDLDQKGATWGVERLLVTAADESTIPATSAVYEKDDRFRRRIQLAMESRTTAGSSGSYEYHILTASPHVLDVNIDQPEFGVASYESNQITLTVAHDARLSQPVPGYLAITLLIDPDADKSEVKALVEASLDAEETIPITDTPHLLDSEILHYQVEATLYCYPGPSTTPILEAAEQALQEYTEDHYRLGHDIAISGLHQAAHQNQVQRVELNIEEDIVVQPWQAAKCTGINVVLGGRDV